MRPSRRSRRRPLPESWRFEAIGTTWQIDTADPLPEPVRSAVTTRIGDFDRTWSRFRDDGAVGRLRAGEPVDLGADAPALLGLYDRLVALTDGAVNPLVGAGLERLGYDAGYSLRPSGDPSAAPPWASAVRDGAVLTVPVGAVLDVGAAGKGLLVDAVAEVVLAAGQACVVDAGGDLAHHGPTNDAGTLRVALEHPADPRRAVGVAELSPGHALCGSAINRRAWGEDLHHVLDARDGRPTAGVVATWVVAGSAAEADGLATALFFLDAEAQAEQLAAAGWPDLPAVWLDATGVHATASFPGEVFA